MDASPTFYRMRTSAVLAVAMLVVALVAWCSRTSTRYHRMTGMDRCMGMPIYAGPAGPFVGYLIGGAIVDAANGPVRAIDLTVEVDGRRSSVWLRESEVMKWYVPMGVISPKECRWTSPNLLPQGKWQPSSLEYGLDVALWHRLFDDWTTHRGLFTAGPPI